MCKFLPRLIVVSLLLAWPATSLAQFADEVWIEPPFWVEGQYGSGQRSDFISVVANAGAWTTVRNRTTTFSTFVNTLAVGVPSQALDATEIDAMVLGLSGLRVDFNVGGLRKPPGPSGPVQCDQMGIDTAARDFVKLRRWVERNGQIFSLTTDHAISGFSMGPYASGDLVCVESGGSGTFPLSTSDLQFWVGRLSDYFEAIQNHFYSRCDGSDGEVGDPRFCQDLRFGVWEGASAFQESTPNGGPVYPSRGTFPPIEYSEVLSALAAELETRFVTNPNTLVSESIRGRWNHLNIDHRAEAVCLDGNPNEAACTTGPDLAAHGLDYCAGDDDNLMCFEWDFGRVLEIERLGRQEGLGIGISNHLSSFNDILDLAHGDSFARDVALRYTSEYAEAGGNPDFLQVFMWIQHPRFTGPEELPNSFMNIAKQILDGPFPEALEIPYLVDSFGAQAWSWSLSPASSVKSVTCGSSTCYYLDTPASGSFEWAQLETENLGASRIGVSLKLSNTSGAGSEWAALQFRPQGTPPPYPWQPLSGLSVLVRNDAGGTVDTISLILDGSSTIASAKLSEMGIVGLSGWFRLELDVRGNRVRVAVVDGGVTKKVIDVRVDEASAQGHLAEGPLLLLASQADVTWDDLRIDQLRLRSLLLSDDFDDNQLTPEDWILPPVGFSVGSGVVTSSGSGSSQLTAAVGEIDDLRISTQVQLAGGTGWAGIHLRKKGPAVPPWSGTEGGFLVHLKTDGTLSGYNKSVGGSGNLFAPVLTGFNPVANPVALGVELVDDRLRVFIADALSDPFSTLPVAEVYYSCPSCGDAGEIGLFTLNQAATFDRVEIDTLD